MAQTGLSGCLHWSSNLILHLPTQNRPFGLICEAKRVFLAYFVPSFVAIGPHLGHSESGKWPSFSCLPGPLPSWGTLLVASTASLELSVLGEKEVASD